MQAARTLRGRNLLLVIGWLVLLAGCAQLPPRAELPHEQAPPPASEGAIAERVMPALAAHPGMSGFRLVSVERT